MKKILFMAVMSAMLFSFPSCNNDDSQENISKTADLRVETEIAGMASTYAPVFAFVENSKLSLWVTPGTLGTNYNLGPYNNVWQNLKVENGN